MLFFRSLKGRCRGNQFWIKNGLNRPTHLHSLPWHSQNGLQFRTFDFKRFICDDVATSSKHLVNFSPVTQWLKREKDVYPPLVDQQFGYAAPLLDLAGIITEFCFTHTLEGVTAMPRGLHVRLRHAFLVISIIINGKNWPVYNSLHSCKPTCHAAVIKLPFIPCYSHIRSELWFSPWLCW